MFPRRVNRCWAYAWAMPICPVKTRKASSGLLKRMVTSPGVSWGSFRKPFSVPVTVNPLAPGISSRRVFPWGYRQASSLTRLSRQDKNFSARNRQVETMLQVAHCRHIFTDP